ncbi:hypothetical protein ACFQHV_09315 [Promicromonospora thailandica]|uniref:Uncharacterized protein YxjI n=1 Tax=Promicromonospora thailandica TaxID=765201 RepID=A0A9X2G5Y5_9MICO|nr:hypothetical protein [Promicromonospora thailandica]MCP2266240.1 Uncharacterized protein YxjI [Promicromonospora thailandica]BFF20730.1 hypothetical protein GCM10025730_42510 [Promicromonospora thailandica]
MNTLQAQTRLIVRQRVRMLVNQYEVHGARPDGSEGDLYAFAQQKRMAFREQVTLYTDDSRTEPVLGFKARQVIDLGATYDIVDAGGSPIGSFRKDFARSLLRSTWHLEQPGYATLTGAERSTAVALIRRFTEIDWLPYHFDFLLDGRPAFSVEKKWGLRDRYVVDIHDPQLDRRLVTAMAIALDALQER